MYERYHSFVSAPRHARVAVAVGEVKFVCVLSRSPLTYIIINPNPVITSTTYIAFPNGSKFFIVSSLR